MLIGLIVLAMAFAEGSANDWLPLLMVDGHGTSATAGSLTFMLFSVAMTTGRFTGGPLLVRYGPAAVVRAGALVAAAGVALVVFSDDALLAGAAFLVGPPSLGFLADHVGLRNAMVVVLVLLGGAALITRALRTPPSGAGEEPPGAQAPGARQSDLV